jgi:hypothetical protein
MHLPVELTDTADQTRYVELGGKSVETKITLETIVMKPTAERVQELNKGFAVHLGLCSIETFLGKKVIRVNASRCCPVITAKITHSLLKLPNNSARALSKEARTTHTALLRSHHRDLSVRKVEAEKSLQKKRKERVFVV